MAVNVDRHLETFQSNVYPAMLKELADHLGVSMASLDRLGLGWVPIVKFKKGFNYQGWWVIPERDDKGEPVGLSLRSTSDFKVMFPGTKHGLIYAINPEHRRGSVGYKPGQQNWIRIAEAGIECPVCGKPDGCLISAEDPGDPRAAICIRQKDGANKPMRFGYLHILKEEGHISKTASLLSASDLPVLVVEGMTDTATALDMGFEAVGRPSNLACMDMLKDVLRGRKVIVIGENDEINPATGKRPGEEGMIAACQVLRTVCPEVKRILPPPGVKDLRAWKTAHDLTADDLLAYVEANAETKTDDVVIPDHRPLTYAQSYLMGNFRMAGRYTLRSFKNMWFKFKQGKYVMQEDYNVEKPLYPWAHNKYVNVENAKGETSIKRVEANKGWVTNVVDAMHAETMVDGIEAPCWINDAIGPNPKELIVFGNGIMHVPAYLAGEEDYMMDPTPDLFTLACLPFAFDPTAQCLEWRKFLRSSLGDEHDKIKLLQEYMGYCMTTDTSEHKFLILRGVTASGKSTIIDVVRELVGGDHFATPKFKDLMSDFGLAPLVGTLVAAMPDFRLPQNGDNMAVLELILNIVGEDAVQINRKFKDHLKNHKLMTRFLFGTNEFPSLPDHSGALKRRMMICEFKRSFAGREDRALRDKLAAEIPGIAVWALEGYRRLKEQNGFTEPVSMRDALSEWHRDASPVGTFIEECVEIKDGSEIVKQDLYNAFRQWCEERSIHPMSFSNFKQRFVASMPSTVGMDAKIQGTRKHSIFTGCKLVGWASKQYLGRPTNG